MLLRGIFNVTCHFPERNPGMITANFLAAHSSQLTLNYYYILFPTDTYEYSSTRPREEINCDFNQFINLQSPFLLPVADDLFFNFYLSLQVIVNSITTGPHVICLRSNRRVSKPAFGCIVHNPERSRVVRKICEPPSHRPLPDTAFTTRPSFTFCLLLKRSGRVYDVIIPPRNNAYLLRSNAQYCVVYSLYSSAEAIDF